MDRFRATRNSAIFRSDGDRTYVEFHSGRTIDLDVDVDEYSDAELQTRLETLNAAQDSLSHADPSTNTTLFFALGVLTFNAVVWIHGTDGLLYSLFFLFLATGIVWAGQELYSIRYGDMRARLELSRESTRCIKALTHTGSESVEQRP